MDPHLDDAREANQAGQPASRDEPAIAAPLYERTREQLLGQQETPLSTYRVQLHREFDFARAQRGRAVPGAARGERPLHLALPPGDAGQQPRLRRGRPHRGEPRARRRGGLRRALRCAGQRGLGLVLDIVPNHMGIGRRQRAGGTTCWRTARPRSTRSFFDIDWNPVKAGAAEQGPAPDPGRPVRRGARARRAAARVSRAAAFSVRYFDHVFPLSPRPYQRRARPPARRSCEHSSGRVAPDFVELQSILTGLRHLPSRGDEPRRTGRSSGSREKEVLKRRLASAGRRLARGRASTSRTNVARCQRQPGRSAQLRRARRAARAPGLPAGVLAGGRRGDQLPPLLRRQRAWPPSAWRTARSSRRPTRSSSSSLARGQGARACASTTPTGCSIPSAYFLRLQEDTSSTGRGKRAARRRLDDGELAERWSDALLRALARRRSASDPDSPLCRAALRGGREDPRAAGERCPTTGRSTAPPATTSPTCVNGLFVDAAQRAGVRPTSTSASSASRSTSTTLVYEKKKLIMQRVACRASSTCWRAQLEPHLRDEPAHPRLHPQHAAPRAASSSSPASRSTAPTLDAGARGRRARRAATSSGPSRRARARDPTTNASLFDFLEDVLLRRYPEHLDRRRARRSMLRFAMKLQQLTGPVMAKGLEDTAFYVYNRLVSLNEVGGEPERFGTTVGDLPSPQRRARRATGPARSLATLHPRHQAQRGRAGAHRRALRDARRVAPRARGLVREAERAAPHARSSGKPAPDRNDEYLLYQTLLGAWPMGEHRTRRSWRRSATGMRELHGQGHPRGQGPHQLDQPRPGLRGGDRPASSTGSWTRACRGRSSTRRGSSRSASSGPGQVNSLAQLVLKLACPGRAGHLPGLRAVGPVAGRSGQPAAGRLPAPRRAARRAAPRSTARRR